MAQGGSPINPEVVVPSTIYLHSTGLNWGYRLRVGHVKGPCHDLVCPAEYFDHFILFTGLGWMSMAGQDAWSPKRTKIKLLLLMVESTQTVSRTYMFGWCLFYERSKFHLLMVKMPPEIKYATQIAFSAWHWRTLLVCECKFTSGSDADTAVVTHAWASPRVLATDPIHSFSMLSIPRTPKCDDTNVTLNTPKKTSHIRRSKH